MRIKNIQLFHSDGTIAPGTLEIDGEYIVSDASDDQCIDGEGLLAIPGLVDIHHHGSMGKDLSQNDPKALDIMGRYLASQGITAYCPTSMAFSEEILTKTFSMVKDYEDQDDAAACLGINMEGPFLAMSKKGAQNPKYIMNADLGMFTRLNAASGGKIKVMTMAPELPGSMDFIREASKVTKVSIGHSECDYDVAKEAIDAGVTHLTHIFNGMTPFTHREPGIVGAGAEDQRVVAELICDGVHIHPSAVRAVFKLFDNDRVVLVSDNMMAAGMEDGVYELGGQAVQVKGRSATLVEGNSLAGSVTNLMDCMRQAVAFGIPKSTAIKAATINPAKAIGVDDRHGALAPGYYADVLLVDEDLQVQKIILRGKELN